MSWQGAAVANQVAEQSNLSLGHRPLAVAFGPSRQRDPGTRAEVVEPAPTAERQELVVPGCANRPAEARAQPVHRLSPGRKRVRDEARLESPRFGVERRHTKTGLADELTDRPVDPVVRQVDARVANETAGLA